MNGYRIAAAAAMLAALAACAAPPAATAVDPYAGGRYTGAVPPGALPGGSAEDFRRTAGDTVLFPENDATLDGTARATLARQAAWLKQHGSFSTVIEGHSDEQGTREYNLALGARRASAVQEYLILQGLEPGRIRTSSYGKERPVEVCSTPDCQVRNRRAVTVVMPGAGV
ncbi:OmpA family protein [Paracoccus sp. SJTW-4]|uniref:OmpA family protein n=1 Tax=Paracoccus sp. SJTW-4 TaxID=3078428 RepID=UPI0039ECD2E2